MSDKLINVLVGLFIFFCVIVVFLITMIRTKDLFSNPDPEVINKHMQELSKSCVETHNGTFTIKVSVGNKNNIEYECI